MAIYNGTNGNDLRTGLLNQSNLFNNFGLGSDTVTGGERDDIFVLLVDKHVDVIDGGGGKDDLINYVSSDQGLKIRLDAGNGEGEVQLLTSLTKVATLRSIENVIGTRYNDYISGTQGANGLDGGSGNDDLIGLGGNDELIGGAGNDNLWGGSDDDTLTGGTGNDFIHTGTDRNTVDAGTGDDSIMLEFDGTGLTADRDTIEGGAGVDTIGFTENLSGGYGVSVSLDIGTASSIYVDGSFTYVRQEATLSSIENVNGTNRDDVIQGDGNANTLRGYDGKDILDGQGGIDVIYAGEGNDTIRSLVDDQVDTIYGGMGTDTVSYLSDSSFVIVQDGVQVTLSDTYGGMGTTYVTRTVTSPNGGTTTQITTIEDLLYEIENVTGTKGADTLTGNSGNNELIGGEGTDIISGGGGSDTLDGGADRDILTGGAGNDTFRFSFRGTGLEADQVLDFQSGADHIDFRPFFSRASEFHNNNDNDTPAPEFIGNASFSGDGNELRVFTNSMGQSVVQLDLDGGGLGEFDIEIIVTGAVGQNDFFF